MKPKKTNELGIAGMVLGIIAVVFSCVLLGGVLGIIGLSLSISGLYPKEKSSGSAIAGTILNASAMLIAIIILIIITLLSSDTSTEKVSSFEAKESVQQQTEPSEIPKSETPAPDALPSESSEPHNEMCEVGEIAETTNLRITFVSAEEYKSDNKFIQPESGNVFYRMEFEFENISETDQYVSSFNFKCYADSYDMEQRYLDDIDLDATLSKGKKTKGYIFFEVPKDATEITLEYETNYWTGNKIIFIVK